MQIAFYAPLKSPAHPVPSGDRRMARMLVQCIEAAGHRVRLVSGLRSYLREPEDATDWAAIEAGAAAERARIAAEWGIERPDAFVCYHPYYKSPDLLGPSLCARFRVPYVTVESSYSARRNIGLWADTQAQVRAGLAQAAVNICLTGRDREGILAEVPDARVAMLAPFIDAAPFAAQPAPEPGHLVSVAMMRAGDKWDSFRHLEAALRLVPGDWHLTVAGDGSLRAEVAALFYGFPAGRVRWLGQVHATGVARVLSQGAVYVWPGCGEAYGLAYLEAQAAGLPVVGFRTAGVPEVVADGETGLLVDPGDDAAFAGAVGRLLSDETLRARMGAAARARVRAEHGLEAAVVRLDAILRGAR